MTKFYQQDVVVSEALRVYLAAQPLSTETQYATCVLDPSARKIITKPILVTAQDHAEALWETIRDYQSKDQVEGRVFEVAVYGTCHQPGCACRNKNRFMSWFAKNQEA
jgi:hypothetical protein